MQGFLFHDRVGRIHEDDVDRTRRLRERCGAQGIREHRTTTIPAVELVDVPLEDGVDVTILFDHQHFRGTETDRFEPHGAHAREEIEHVRVLEPPPQHVEE